MEKLKSSAVIVLATIVLNLSSTQAQSFEETQKGFKASYVSEYKGDYNAAINDIQKIYKEGSYESNLRMGWLNYSAKKHENALKYYQKAINLKKYSVEALLGYITVATVLKKTTDVYNKYEEILKIDPYNSTANYWVGVNYYYAKKYDIAAKYFELVVNMYPFDYDANHMLGWTYIGLGKTSDAKILFEKALLNKPTDESAKAGLNKCK
jgi:tetratricopeptide (TPR) repeat protein